MEIKSRLWIIALVLSHIASGCQFKKSVRREEHQPYQAMQRTTVTYLDSTTEQIQVLVFRLQHDSTTLSKERCELVSKQVFEGRLKQRLSTRLYVENGDLICNFYDRQGNEVSSHLEEDPLTVAVEAAEEDGTLKRHVVHREWAELVLRVQLHPTLKQLIIGKVMPDKSIATLIALEL